MGAYESCREVCGNPDYPGLGIEVPEYVDHKGKETTLDQLRIEAALKQIDLKDKTLLHVGVGNSGLAERFSQKVNWIDGLTVSTNEKEYADSLGILNYKTFLLNKHSREFILRLKNKYDFIIDNNFASFSCCKYHFYLMLDNYMWALNPGGKILTDQRGLSWACLDPAFILYYEDLVRLQQKFPLKVSKITDTVYSMEAIARPEDHTKITMTYRLYEVDGEQVMESRQVPQQI